MAMLFPLAFSVTRLWISSLQHVEECRHGLRELDIKQIPVLLHLSINCVPLIHLRWS